MDGNNGKTNSNLPVYWYLLPWLAGLPFKKTGTKSTTDIIPAKLQQLGNQQEVQGQQDMRHYRLKRTFQHPSEWRCPRPHPNVLLKTAEGNSPGTKTDEWLHPEYIRKVQQDMNAFLVLKVVPAAPTQHLVCSYLVHQKKAKRNN